MVIYGTHVCICICIQTILCINTSSNIWHTMIACDPCMLARHGEAQTHTMRKDLATVMAITGDSSFFNHTLPFPTIQHEARSRSMRKDLATVETIAGNLSLSTMPCRHRPSLYLVSRWVMVWSMPELQLLARCNLCACWSVEA